MCIRDRASAVPPAGGSQGTGQDLTVGGEVPVTLLSAKPVPAGVGAGPVVTGAATGAGLTEDGA